MWGWVRTSAGESVGQNPWRGSHSILRRLVSEDGAGIRLFHMEIILQDSIYSQVLYMYLKLLDSRSKSTALQIALATSIILHSLLQHMGIRK